MNQEKKEYGQFIHIGDFTWFMKKRKRKYACIALGCAFAAIALVGLVDPHYMLHASFKEANVRSETSSANMLKTLLKTSRNVDLGTQALSVMKSRQLIEIAVQSLHIQGELKIASWTERLKTKIKRRYQPSYDVARQNTLCRCSHLRYKGKELKRFYIKINSVGAIEVYSAQQNKALVPSGNALYQEEDLVFSLEWSPIWNESQERLLLEIYPMETVIDRIMNKLKVKVRRDDATMLDLVYRDQNPIRGAAFLNTLMKEYKRYLLRENERIAEAQLNYLTKRQGEITSRLDEILQTHVEYLKSNLDDQGLMGLHQELEIIEGRKKRHQQRVLEIDFELNKLDKVKGNKLFTLESVSFEGKKLQQELIGLKKQKEGLELAQSKRSALVAKQKKAEEPMKLHSMIRLQPKAKEIQFWEEKKLDVGQSSFSVLPMFSSIKQNATKLAYQKEHYVQQDAQQNKAIPIEFQGMSLEMARELHLAYTHELDETVVRKKELEVAIHKIQDLSFEVSSLASLAGEGMPQEVIKETTKLSAELKNEKYFSEKDRVRMQEQIHRNKSFLKHHFLDVLHLAQLRSQMVADKIENLHHIIGELLSQEITLIEAQIEKILEEQLLALAAEKKYIQDKLVHIQEELKDIPQKWLMENRLQLQSDLNISMMEGMSQLVESKNIEHHLLQVESKPIDEAYIPLKPKQNSLFLYGVLGAIVGLMSSLSMSIGKRIVKGFPVSLAGLRFRGLKAIGPFSKHWALKLEILSKYHLEMLRMMTSFLSQEKACVVGVILNTQLDYSKLLAELLKISGKATLVIELFPRKEEGESGLLDYLTGRTAELALEKHRAFDVVTLGISDLYRMEILSRSEWPLLLETLKKSYQVILLVTRTEASSIEAKQMLHYCQKMLITLDEETLDDLYPYIEQEKSIQHPFALYVAFE